MHVSFSSSQELNSILTVRQWKQLPPNHVERTISIAEISEILHTQTSQHNSHAGSHHSSSSFTKALFLHRLQQM